MAQARPLLRHPEERLSPPAARAGKRPSAPCHGQRHAGERGTARRHDVTQLVEHAGVKLIEDRMVGGVFNIMQISQ